MSRQLAFDLPQLATFGRADFFPSPANQPALDAIDDWQNWPGSKMLLVGPAGSGKTHLAHIWAESARATLIPATADLPGLARTAIAIDDADHIAGDPAAEAALFHLHNLILPARQLLMTAATPPRDWRLALPDLQSRLQAAPLTRLALPDDALLSAVLIKLFADRQIAVSPALIRYLLNRMDRSIASAQYLVDRLDAQALALGRPVNRALAASLFPEPSGPDVLDSGPNG